MIRLVCYAIGAVAVVAAFFLFTAGAVNLETPPAGPPSLQHGRQQP